MSEFITINGVTKEIDEYALSQLSKETICRLVDLPCTNKTKKKDALQILKTQILEHPESLKFIYASNKEALGLSPYYLEQLIGCTTTERKRWTKDSRLKVIGTNSFHKYGSIIEAPVYDRWQAEFEITDVVLESWREQDKAEAAANRKAGQEKAKITHKKNVKIKNKFALSYQTMITEWKQYGEEEAILLELAYWTMWQNRWAKTDQEKAATARSKKNMLIQKMNGHYKNKESALKLITASDIGKVAFYRPANPHKLRVYFCKEHYQYVKDELYYGYSAIDIYLSNQKLYDNCPACQIEKYIDYYSLYYIEVSIGEYKFSFHTPYDIGKKYLPDPKTLPLVEHQEQEGMFRFGRGLTENEMVTHTEKLTDQKFKEALTKYEQLKKIR